MFKVRALVVWCTVAVQLIFFAIRVRGPLVSFIAAPQFPLSLQCSVVCGLGLCQIELTNLSHYTTNGPPPPSDAVDDDASDTTNLGDWLLIIPDLFYIFFWHYTYIIMFGFILLMR